MKRTAYLSLGILALSLAIYTSNKLWAQTGTTPATTATSAVSGKTKIALLNLTYVVKNYKKFTAYQEDLKKAVDPFQTNDAKLKGEGEKLAKEAQTPTCTASRREEIERQLKVLQRQVEDNKNDAQKVLIKKQEEQLKTLYMDIREVVSRTATTYGYDVVMHYNDATETAEYNSPQNIARKMQAGSLMPMYIGANVDISAHVLTTLNAAYSSGAPITTPATSGGGATPGRR